MAIIGIVAIDRRGAIGRAGSLPWHYSSDLKFFKQQTLHHACVMGRRTWLSLKKPLKERLNIILSRSTEMEPQPGVLLFRDKLSVLSLKDYLNCNLFIIGGSEVYKSFLPDIEEWIITEIPLATEDADTFMPEGFLDQFTAYQSLQLEEDLKATFYRRAQSQT